MVCNKCNKENPDDNVVCGFCGNVLVEVPDNKYIDKPKKEEKESKVGFFKQLENTLLKKFANDIDDEEEDDDELDIDDDDLDDEEE